MVTSKAFIVIISILLSSILICSQEDTLSNFDSAKTRHFMESLMQLKISGYIQTEFQNAQKDGIKSFSGGDFFTNTKNRFLIRRGRLKFKYDTGFSQYVAQIDVTEKGIAVKDVYAEIREQWLNIFGLTAGLFGRPFGFEIGFSSGSRESPERSRIFQTIFPGERDMGVQLSIFPENSKGFLSHIDLAAGIFTGNGVGPETDNAKDFIGRIGYKFPIAEKKLTVSGGFSGYFGAVRLDDNKKRFVVKNTSVNSVDSVSRYVERKYIGVDVQLQTEISNIGKTVLRGEYIQGSNPGSFDSNSPYKAGSGDIYLRNMNGYYLLFVQDLGKYNQLLVKYDVFDPNTDISLSNPNLVNINVSYADVRYSTIGFGWIYHLNKNVKLTFFYEIVKNEEYSANLENTILVPFTNDQKDNVLTVRMQFKF